MELFQKHRQKIVLSVIFAVLVYAILLLASDTGQLLVEVKAFEWALLPIIIGLTLFNYGVRFIKWHWYLGVVGVKNLPWLDSLIIFLSGFSMTLTPGKAGELLKAFLVKQRTGTPVATTAPTIFAERLTDGLALLILASAGFLIFDNPQVRLVMLAVVIGAAVVVFLLQRRELANRLMARMEHVSLIGPRIDAVRALYASAYQLVRFKALVIGIGLGIISWAGECFALALILVGLGVPFSWTLVALSAFAMGFSTLAGSILLVPGGLGVAEATIAGLLIAFGKAPWLPEGTITPPTAAAATLMIRFCTLWFGWFLGLICLGIAQRRFGRIAREGEGWSALEPATMTGAMPALPQKEKQS